MFGYSRQAYYQLQKYRYKSQAQTEIVLQMVRNERKTLPGIGGRKLLSLIEVLMKKEEIQMGRDAFFDLLKENNLLVRRSKTRVYTTMSRHRYRMYPNLIRGKVLTGPHQLWVSDITYIPTTEGYLYLSLVTDAYSRKIVGWDLSHKLEASGAVSALEMALSQLPDDKAIDLIHHSDRGVQYCCDKYVAMLKSRQITISMTENGDPLENPVAERVNGILKSEWLNKLAPESKKETAVRLAWIIEAYNTKRPHMSIDMMTPEAAHITKGIIPRQWKNYWKERQEAFCKEDTGLIPS
ncbi:MAG TPA: IS3 family transposase [Lunatimonas sp.]|nr:IS3 family transposase [Lunatimonas sp.]